MKKGILAGLSLAAGLAGGAAAAGKGMKKLVSSTQRGVDLYQSCYNITSQWLGLKQKGISLEKYFMQNGYKSIAIYGMGRLGGMLYEELKDSDVEIKYGIDRDSYCTYPGLDIIQPEDEFEKVDVIVVTPILIYDEIAKMLSQKMEIPVVSIEEVVYEV